jgi:hypothetical protein
MLEDRCLLSADVVLHWNELLVQSLASQPAQVPMARNMALVHVALFDAVNAIDRSYEPYYTGGTAVDGQTERLADMARVLVAIVEERRLPADDQGTPLPLRSAELAQILAQTYGGFPGVIAATIAYLHEKGGRRERWLLEVLQSRPELHALAEAVERELWGG